MRCHLLLLIQASVTHPNILASVRVSPHERTALVWSVCFIQNGQDSINVGQLIWLQIEFCATEFFFIVSTDQPVGRSLTVWHRWSTVLSATLHRNVQEGIKPTFLPHHRRAGGLPPDLPALTQPSDPHALQWGLTNYSLDLSAEGKRDSFSVENVKMPFNLNLPNKSSKLGNSPRRLSPPANQFHTAAKMKWMTWTFTTNQTKSANKLFEVL